MSEGEELRQAAAAAAAHSRRAAAKQEEVIVLTDSDEEDDVAPPARHLAPQHRPPLQHTPAGSQAARPHPPARPVDVWGATPRAIPASLQPGSSHAAPARAPPLPQVSSSIRNPRAPSAVALQALQVLRRHRHGVSVGDPSFLCRAGWGSSSPRQAPGGRPHCRRGPRLRIRRRAFRASAPRRSSRGAASPSASPTASQTHHPQEVYTRPP